MKTINPLPWIKDWLTLQVFALGDYLTTTTIEENYLSMMTKILEPELLSYFIECTHKKIWNEKYKYCTPPKTTNEGGLAVCANLDDGYIEIYRFMLFVYNEVIHKFNLSRKKNMETGYIVHVQYLFASDELMEYQFAKETYFALLSKLRLHRYSKTRVPISISVLINERWEYLLPIELPDAIAVISTHEEVCEAVELQKRLDGRSNTINELIITDEISKHINETNRELYASYSDKIN